MKVEIKKEEGSWEGWEEACGFQFADVTFVSLVAAKNLLQRIKERKTKAAEAGNVESFHTLLCAELELQAVVKNWSEEVLSVHFHTQSAEWAKRYL